MTDYLSDLTHFRVEQVSPHVLHAVFSSPPLNAFTTGCYTELSAIVREVNSNEAIAALAVTSDQKHFSAGADRNQLKRDAEAGARHVAERRLALNAAWGDFRNCTAPIVVGVNGGAVGIGAALAACADVIIAAEDAFFSIPEIDIGLVGGAKALTRILPPATVRVMALTGSRLPAEQLCLLGAVHKVVDRDQLTAEVLAMATAIGEKGSPVARQWRQAFKLTESMAVPDGVMVESALNQALN
ncbi:enoyl-CoA hydratase-related protein [Ornithinimicrobium cavernae]|uniref:enoyl-CoA hydratase-related protein n=1 Tax=Ornithinimicrobium cavernae TaxID=2666047 RepID=UPI000D696A22|nr:enoyl-CoA hydratase-related protein [Ornithinimicrobium cavernae]